MLPKDKFDIQAIEHFKTAPPSQVVPLLPELLTWIQDMNWPVAEPTIELLMTYPTEITPLVEDVLLGDDDMWKYWCLQRIVPNLPFYSKMVLANAVEQIAQSVNPRDADLVKLAKSVLLSFES
ncbi:DUF5071 domain-containing protein [Solibacillus sp. FSL H8-0538]|uniref:DUF5071 domain-containing protein n=1 Tax=Solibacillus sp. FSL H8-0538 TaxID=2921400 RepID=UPI0030F5D2E7